MAKATDKASETQAQANAAPPKSKMKLVLVALLVVMTGAAGFLGWKYFSSTKASSAEAAAPSTEGESGHGEEGAVNENAVINFEPFLVNLADTDAFRYLRVTIRIQVDKAAAEKVATNDVFTSQMRDAILSTLTTKVAASIVQPEGKEELKAEIMQKLNGFLPERPVKAVFFMDFVVQL